MPDMHHSPAYKAQEPGSLRQPVEGTVSRDAEIYPYPDQPEASSSLVNPIRRTKENLYWGKKLYNTYCIVCHGAYGEGDGSIVPKFPRPPSLQSDKVRNWKDGRIFHVITMGQNLMPSYATQVDVDERWAIINYVRVIQRAKNPSAQDLKKLEEW